MYVIPDRELTLDSEAGTITLSSAYVELSIEQIARIRNLTKSEIIYDAGFKQGTITVSNGVISFEDTDHCEDTDIIRIEVDTLVPGEYFVSIGEDGNVVAVGTIDGRDISADGETLDSVVINIGNRDVSADGEALDEIVKVINKPTTVAAKTITQKGGIFNGDFSIGEGSTTGGWIGDISYGWWFGDISATGYAEYVDGRIHVVCESADINEYITLRNAPTGGITPQRELQYLVPVSPSTLYCISFDLEVDLTSINSQGVTLELKERDSDGAIIRSLDPIGYLNGSIQKMKYTYNFTASTITKYFQFILSIQGEVGEIWIDNIKLEQVNAQNVGTKLAVAPEIQFEGVTSTDSIDQSQATIDGYPGLDVARQYTAQQFLPTEEKFTGITILKTTGNGTFAGDITIEIRSDDSGKPSSTVLASKIIDNATWLAYPNLTDWFVDLPCILSVDGSISYWIVFISSTSDDDNFTRLSSASGAYANGVCKTSPDNSTWTAQTYDLYFCTHFAKHTKSPAVQINGTEVRLPDVELLTGATILIKDGIGKYYCALSGNNVAGQKKTTDLFEYSGLLDYSSYERWQIDYDGHLIAKFEFGFPMETVHIDTFDMSYTTTGMNVSYSPDGETWTSLGSQVGQDYKMQLVVENYGYDQIYVKYDAIGIVSSRPCPDGMIVYGDLDCSDVSLPLMAPSSVVLSASCNLEINPIDTSYEEFWKFEHDLSGFEEISVVSHTSKEDYENAAVTEGKVHIYDTGQRSWSWDARNGLIPSVSCSTGTISAKYFVGDNQIRTSVNDGSMMGGFIVSWDEESVKETLNRLSEDVEDIKGSFVSEARIDAPNGVPGLDNEGLLQGRNIAADGATLDAVVDSISKPSTIKTGSANIAGGIPQNFRDAEGGIATTAGGWIEDNPDLHIRLSAGNTMSSEFDKDVIGPSGFMALKLETVDNTGYGNLSFGSISLDPRLVLGLPSVKYRFSMPVKTQGVVDESVFIDIRTYDEDFIQDDTLLSEKLSGNNDWTLLSVEFISPADTDNIMLRMQQSVEGSSCGVTGAIAWFDIGGAKLEQITEQTANIRLAVPLSMAITGETTIDNIDQYQIERTGGGSIGLTSSKYYAQQFIPSEEKLTGIIFQRSADTGTYIGDITISIQTDDSDEPSGITVASKNYTNAQWEALGFASDIYVDLPCLLIVDGATKYWIVFTSSTMDNSNFTKIYVSTGMEYTRGLSKYSADASTWLAATNDLYFKTMFAKHTISPLISANGSKLDLANTELLPGAVIEINPNGKGEYRWKNDIIDYGRSLIYSLLSTSSNRFRQSYASVLIGEVDNILVWELDFVFPASTVNLDVYMYEGNQRTGNIYYSFDNSEFTLLHEGNVTDLDALTRTIMSFNAAGATKVYLKFDMNLISGTWGINELNVTADLDCSDAILPLITPSHVEQSLVGNFETNPIIIDECLEFLDDLRGITGRAVTSLLTEEALEDYELSEGEIAYHDTNGDTWTYNSVLNGLVPSTDKTSGTITVKYLLGDNQILCSVNGGSMKAGFKWYYPEESIREALKRLTLLVNKYKQDEQRKSVTVSEDFEITADDEVILCNGTITVTLPRTEDATNLEFKIKNIGNGTIAVTVADPSSETIDGATSATLSTQYDSLTLICNGSAWYII